MRYIFLKSSNYFKFELLKSIEIVVLRVAIQVPRLWKEEHSYFFRCVILIAKQETKTTVGVDVTEHWYIPTSNHYLLIAT